jgi:hypothetical protein
VTDHHSRLIAVPALEPLGADLPDTTDPETCAELVSVTRPSRFRYTPTGEGRLETRWRVATLTGNATTITYEMPEPTFAAIPSRRASRGSLVDSG